MTLNPLPKEYIRHSNFQHIAVAIESEANGIIKPDSEASFSQFFNNCCAQRLFDSISTRR
jgi:hypothetical protein